MLNEPPQDKELDRMMDKAFEGAMAAGLEASVELAGRFQSSATRLSALARKT